MIVKKQDKDKEDKIKNILMMIRQINKDNRELNVLEFQKRIDQLAICQT